MRVLINTLSIGSMSGEHVVYGFLRELVANAQDPADFVLLHCASQRPPSELMERGVGAIAVSDHLKQWFIRPLWEISRLPALLRKERIDRVFNVSGAITPWLRVPQISLAMNPWCYVKDARSGWAQEIKAFFQRRSYRYAFRKAAHIVYISEHLRDLYRNANQDCADAAAPSTIAYVGLDHSLFESAERMRDSPRRPYSILSVSAFAPWKGVETTLHALRLVRDGQVPATLSLVGPWPDAAYRAKMEALVEKLDLADAVTIHGKVSREELYRQYASHQVFCLMSTCESFGIPAAEAMAFEKPVISTNCCAIAEVCHGAGYFGPAAKPGWVADQLVQLLSSGTVEAKLSNVARERASRLHWGAVTVPLRHLFGVRTDQDLIAQDVVSRSA